MVGLEDVRVNHLVNAFIQKGNDHLSTMGFGDHGFLHVTLVSQLAREIMKKLGFSNRLAELAGIAGYMHDIGNVVERDTHSQSGALLAMEILRRMGMDAEEISLISAAIGNHDSGSGHPVNEVAAALILADKTHVHRERVRNLDFDAYDIHDRVNYAVNHSILDIDEDARKITMEISIDIEICPVMEYFEIFMNRLLLCRRAAAFLGCQFELLINGARLL